MRKFFIHILIILSLVLTGCEAEPAEPSTAPKEITTATETTLPTETTVPWETTFPPETEAPVTEMTSSPAETEYMDNTLPYLLRIDRADQSIFAGPGYDYVFAGIVRERGTYTIVEEAWDQEGNLWGKLKSGAGWVDLTEIRSEAYAESLISANYADENLILHAAYHYCPGDGAEYCIPIAIRAYGTLRNVQLCAYEFVGDDFVLGETFFTLPEMDEEMPLVAELAFPGDMTTYGIRFTDAEGNTHVYSIYISGRNGALILTEE